MFIITIQIAYNMRCFYIYVLIVWVDNIISNNAYAQFTECEMVLNPMFSKLNFLVDFILLVFLRFTFKK